MEKTETKVVDIFKKCSIVLDDSSESSKPGENTSSQRIYTKKRLNVPICDVHMDNDYEKNLRTSFRLPMSYVKHFKKIGDEIDVSFDFVVDIADKQWLASRTRNESKDVSKLFTLDAFETIMNTFERFTAVSRDPIPLINAEKLIREQLNWNSQPLINTIGEVYKYWLKKREQLGKPLCRRYWPQVASSDSNPHQVFRTRDKERYRLRKQQKRNDVDSFRKMQQLRREFNKAKALTELIQERELLCQADFEIQREMFEQKLYDLKQSDEVVSGSGSGAASTKAKKPRKEVPFKHTLKFEYINPDEVDEFEDFHRHGGYGKVVNLASSDSDGSDDDHAAQSHKKNFNGSVTGSIISRKNGSSASENKHKGGAGGSGSAGSGAGGAGSSSSSSSSAAAEAKKAAAALSSPGAVAAMEEARKKIQSGESQPKKKKRESSRMVMYTVSNGVTVEVGAGQMGGANANGGSGVLATILTSETAPSSLAPVLAATAVVGAAGGVTTVTTTTGGAAGGATVVNGAATAAVVGDGVTTDAADPAALETKLIHPNLEGPMNLCQPLWPAFMSDLPTRDTVPTTTQRSLTNYIRDLEFKRDAQDQIILPDKYRGRCRVGRGGRVVVDRFPVYTSKPIEEVDYWSIDDPPAAKTESEDAASANESIRYVYPTSVRYKQQLQLAAAAENAVAGLNNAAAIPGLPRTSIGSVVSGPISVAPPTNAVRCVTNSPIDLTSSDPPPAPSASAPAALLASTPSPSVRQMPSSTRPLSEVPLSNRKLRSYNVKIKANNQLLASSAASMAAATAAATVGAKGAAAAAAATALLPSVPLQKLLPTELPSLMPPARLILTPQTKQKLADICGESDSEDERVLIPRALKGYPELEFRSAITKSTLAAAAAAVAASGTTGPVGTAASLENQNPCSKSNVRYNVYM